MRRLNYLLSICTLIASGVCIIKFYSDPTKQGEKIFIAGVMLLLVSIIFWLFAMLVAKDEKIAQLINRLIELKSKSLIIILLVVILAGCDSPDKAYYHKIGRGRYPAQPVKMLPLTTGCDIVIDEDLVPGVLSSEPDTCIVYNSQLDGLPHLRFTHFKYQNVQQ